MNYYTYIYYDPITKIPFYVGKGSGNRAWKHLKRSDDIPFINKIRDLRSKGLMPNIGLYSGLDEEFALFLEMELILHFGRIDNSTGTLFNKTNGGQGLSGRKHSQETIDKIKATKQLNKKPISEETKKKLSNANKGRKMPKQTLEALRASRLGVAVSEETRKKLSEASKRSASKRLLTMSINKQ